MINYFVIYILLKCLLYADDKIQIKLCEIKQLNICKVFIDAAKLRVTEDIVYKILVVYPLKNQRFS